MLYCSPLADSFKRYADEFFSFIISGGKKYSDCLSAIFYTDRKKIASR